MNYKDMLVALAFLCCYGVFGIVGGLATAGKFRGKLESYAFLTLITGIGAILYAIYLVGTWLWNNF
jgi:hypothetical protein